MNRAFDLGGGDEIKRLSTEAFYPIPPSQTFRFFYGPATSTGSVTELFSENTYTLHWCSSNHKDLAAGLTRENLGKAVPKPTLFHRLAKAVIDKGIP